MQVSAQCVCVCLSLYMHMSTYSVEGHLEHKCSLVFYRCPSAELTGRDWVVTAMCRFLGRQCFCVWCVNWDPQPCVSSCATADDIPLGFSACFPSNHLSRASMHYHIIRVYSFALLLAVTSLPSVWLLSTVWPERDAKMRKMPLRKNWIFHQQLCVQFQKMMWQRKPMNWESQGKNMLRIFFKR